MNTKQRWLVLAVAAGLLGGCRSSNSAAVDLSVDAAPLTATRDAGVRPKGNPQPRLPVGSLEIEQVPRPARVKLSVEVAALDQQRQTGLMFRERMGDDEGMLFAFATERYNNFWMHNTLIPLDMFFIDAEWNVVGVVENATPLTDDPRGVDKMSRYVLEVNAGFAARHGFGPGATVKFAPPQGVVMP